ncbi:hypothetical protein F2Q68_00038928 [Brassica cretica]|uniref:Uncharacterized protein n=1 Tax=Brassica cretica TaxID=69181 RepID=A0A8S9MTQ7_BRACR|nr:hypothetical protein F2Q68_00038928 [Brassica cretica]
MSDEIATCVAVEREWEDGEFDLGNESRVSPKPTSPLHLHSTGGKEGRHKIDLKIEELEKEGKVVTKARGRSLNCRTWTTKRTSNGHEMGRAGTVACLGETRLIGIGWFDVWSRMCAEDVGRVFFLSLRAG